MSLDVVPEQAVHTFRDAYPLRPAHLTHRLAGHPLLEIEALGRLAERIRPQDLEHNAATDLPLGISNADIPSTDCRCTTRSRRSIAADRGC